MTPGDVMSDLTEDDAEEGYVAVVYFHGMGSQRRYEETSRLIDSIDTYLTNADGEFGAIRGIRPDIELPNTDGGKSRTFIRSWFIRNKQHSKAQEVRYYEAYWAPIMAGASTPWRVMKWMARRVLQPWHTLRSPWRERHRLRRAALAELYEFSEGNPDGNEAGDFDLLLRSYGSFERLDAQRAYSKGTFAEFKQFLGEDGQHGKTPDVLARLHTLANKWYAFYRNAEIRNAAWLLTILLAIVLSIYLLARSAAGVLRFIADFVELPLDASLSDFLQERLIAGDWKAAAGLVVGVLSLAGISKFLRDYMGDVEAWTTYEETNGNHQRRSKVIAEGVSVMRHVLSDDQCKRVVVVGHSLGTCVAHDTLLSLRRHNKAHKTNDPADGWMDLNRVQHFVTLASPIDKINYFFESFRSHHHRYRRVVDNLRGDITTPPFSRDGKPFAHWINFWDEADVISGALHSPVGRKRLADKVDNVHVSNLRFPDPGASHSAYFGNKTVIRTLFGAIYGNRHNFSDSVDYLGLGEETGRHKLTLIAALSVPWLGLAYAMTYSVVIGAVMAALVAFLSGYWLLTRKSGNREPL